MTTSRRMSLLLVRYCFRLEPSSAETLWLMLMAGAHARLFSEIRYGLESPACDRPTRTSPHNIFNSLFCGGRATEFHEKILHVPFFIHYWHHEHFHLLIFLAMFLSCRYEFACFALRSPPMCANRICACG